MPETVERVDDVAGISTHWRKAGDIPVLYVHGVPTAWWDWLPYLERIGGVAPDLPGFGASAKPADFDYSIDGQILGIRDTFQSFNDPGRPLPPFVTRLTGITDEMGLSSLAA